MEINFKNSATKRYLEKSPLPLRERIFLTDCAEKVFSIFGYNCANLRHNGQRFYLGGQFYNFTFNPVETVAMNIFHVEHTETFKNDTRFKLSLFGDLCFIHPDDLIFIDAVFSNNTVSTFNFDTKSIEMAMVLIPCQIIRNLEMGRTELAVDFTDSNPTQSCQLKTLLEIICHGGVIFDGEKVY